MATLELILKRAEALGLPMAEDFFAEKKGKPLPTPPYICYLATTKERGHDFKNVLREVTGSLELYTDRKDNPELPMLQRRIEKEVLFDVEFRKYQAFISEENMEQTAYEFELLEKIRREQKENG